MAADLWMAYPMATPEGPARIVGVPFFVAFFDSAGRDYVSAWTLWGCVGNVLFWFMVPQIAVSIYGRQWRQARHGAAA